MSKDMTFEVGSGNVFAGLGFDNPEEELLKAKLVREISAIIKRRRLTQAKAADLMGVIQPDMSAIVTGRTVKSPIERLARCIDRLGYEIDVVFRHKARKPSRPAKDLTDIQRASAPIPLHSDRPITPSLIGLARKSRAGW
jgi:predicted XRE-type DNA-binding protein